MTTTKRTLFNGALLECGERKLASLSEEREPRRLLDQVWDTGALDHCLGQGQWTFASRTVQLTPDTGIDPDFGYRYAYERPSDFIRTVALCSDEFMTTPVLSYSQEQSYWFSDVSPIYLEYISNDASYGGDYSLWSSEFVLYVEAYLASRIIKKLTNNDEEWLRMQKVVAIRLRDAKSSSAMEKPTKFLPTGSWVSARAVGTRRDRGSRGSLTG